MLSSLSNWLKGLSSSLHGLSWKDPEPIFYGQALDERILNAEVPDHMLPGEFVYDPPESTVLSAGEYTLNVTYTPEEAKTNKKVKPLKGSVKIVVHKAVPVIHWKKPLPIFVGTQLTRKQLNAACMSVPDGEYTYEPPLRSVIPAGEQMLTVTYEPPPDYRRNYETVEKTVLINIMPLRLPVFIWNEPPSLVYGEPLTEAHLNATLAAGFDPSEGTIVYEPGAGAVLNAGDAQKLTVTFTPFNKIEVSSAERSVFVRVVKAESVLEWPQPKHIYAGTQLGKAQLGAKCSNLPGGSFKYNYRLGEVLPEGTHELTVEYEPDRRFQKNYFPASAAVTVTVMPLHQPVITWPQPASISYGTLLGLEQLCAELSVPFHGFGGEFECLTNIGDWSDVGTITYSPALGTVLDATTESKRVTAVQLNVSFVPLDPSKVLPAAASVMLVVARADPAIEWPDPKPILMHTLLGPEQLCAACTWPGPEGQFIYAPALGAHLAVGTHTLAVTYLPTFQHSRNFNEVTVTVELRVDKPEPRMRWDTPPDVHVGRPLTKKHLSAVCLEAGIPLGSGHFMYDPPINSILPLGRNQPLKLRYRADDKFLHLYREVEVTVFINVIPPRMPVITWDPPKDIPFGSKLTQFQLNARCNVDEGFLFYEPGRGQVLASGETHNLKVTFVPDDHLEWASVSLEVPIYIYKTDPVLTWRPDTYFYAGMALSQKHLCCRVEKSSAGEIHGIMSFQPRLGAILGAGTHKLHATFKCDKRHKKEWNDVSLTIDFVVLPKTFPEVLWPQPEAIVFGDSLSPTQLCASCSTPGRIVYDPPEGSRLDAGDEHALTAHYFPDNPIEYNEVVVTVILVVKKAVPVIVWEPPPFMYIGLPLTRKHLNATCKLPGTMVYCPEMGEILPLGLHTMTVIFKPADSVKHNWTFASSFVTMLVITEGSLFKMPKRYLEPETVRTFPVDDRECLLEPDTLAYFSSSIDCFPPEPTRKVVEKMKASKMVEKDKLAKGEIDLSWTIKRAGKAIASPPPPSIT